MSTKTLLDISEIDRINHESWQIVRTNPKLGIELAQKAFDASAETNYLNGITLATATLGACNVWLSNYDEALKYLFEARKLLEESGDHQKESQVLYHISCTFYFLGDYEKALDYAHQLVLLGDRVNDLHSKANGYNGLGTVYYTINENQKAIDYLKKGIAIAEELKDYTILSRQYDGIGTAYHQLKDIENAILFKQKSLEAARITGVANVEAYALVGLAKLNLDKGNLAEAEKLFLTSLDIRKKLGFKTGIAETLSFLGNFYLDQNNPSKAFEYLTEGIVAAEESSSKEYLYKLNESLARYYESKNDLSNFKKHFQLGFEYKEEFFNEKAKQKIKNAEIQMRMSQMEHEREFLEKKHQELEAYSRDLELLSDLGKKITSLLSIETINRTVFEILNTIMDSPGFGIGIAQPDGRTLIFPGYIEEDKVYEQSVYDLHDENRLAVICFNQERELFINDYENDRHKYIKSDLKPIVGRSVNSIIYLPLKYKDKVVGVLTTQSFKKNAYTEYHLSLVRNLAVYCAIAVENAAMYEKLEDTISARTAQVREQKEELSRSYETMRTLSEIGKQLTSTTKFEDIFTTLYDGVSSLMDAGSFGVRMYYPERNEIEYRFEIEHGKRDFEVINVSMDNDNNYSVWCVKNREVIFINDNINEHKKYVQQIHVVTGDMPHSLIFCPIISNDIVLGVITVQSFNKFAFTANHIDILQNLANYTAIALENANLVENLEERVKARTEEVVRQKEEIEKANENTQLLSHIGREISASLSIESIAEKVYSSINKIMDATIFGIGVLQSESGELHVRGAMENGEKLPDFFYNTNDETKLAVYCLNHAEEIVINDLKVDILKYLKNYQTTNIGKVPESIIYIPLVNKSKVIGTLSVQSFKKDVYNDYHLNLLRNLAVYISSAIDNASLYENLEIRVQERTEEIEKAYNDTKLLGQISKDISASLSVEKIIENVYKSVNELMDATGFGIGIFNPTTQQIVMPGYIEKGEKLDDFYYNLNDDRLATWCFRNKKEIFINDYTIEYKNYIQGLKQPIAGKDSASIIYLPLFLKGEAMGILTIQSFEKNVYTEYHMDILRSLATTIATALDNARLYENMEGEVRIRTAEVVKQKEIIEEKNKHITDSIIYAKRIQEAILPPEEVFCNYLHNSFVLYKPKDIVSGDFYWIERKENKILFAVVDCTGHGVPGAFMSIIGFNGLNQIVNEYNITQPAEILNQLNLIITNTLRQREEDSKIRDGMDMSICCIDLENNRLEFAGANNPIFIVRNNKVIEVTADHHPIGNFIGEDQFRFTNHEITLFANDRIYLSSDGYADQFGGPHGKKLKYTQFRDILLSNHHRPMLEQKQLLDKLFEEWRGELEQIDDVCVIGVGI